MVDAGKEPEDGEAPPLAAGARLGKYVIVRLLGAGGMGAVYEATHSEIGKRVAVKILSPAIAAIPGARTRFLREAQLTTRVRHPHIVDVTDMGTDDGQTYLVMEFLSGEDLAGRLDRGAIPFEEMVDVMLPVCAAVAAAHQAGITHRDLKPQNIFLVTDGRRVHPKVLDFGISKGTSPGDSVGSGTLTATGAVIGTPYYLAPEQIVDNRAAGPASDQYALGVILYECLTGERPYRGDSLFVVFQKIVEGAPRPPRELRPEIPLGLEDVMLRAMLREPRERFASVEAFARALLPFASSRGRLIWEDVFGAPASALPTAPREAAPGSSTVPATDYMPPLPVMPVVMDGVEAPAPARRWGRAVLIGAGILALGAFSALLALRRSSAPAPAVSAPAAASAVEVKAPAVAAPMAPPPVAAPKAPPPAEVEPTPVAPAPAPPALAKAPALPAVEQRAPRPAHKRRGHEKPQGAPKAGVPVVD
jgi:hypothetical protein